MSTGTSPENEQFIQDAVVRGAFESREQVLDAAVGMLREREEVIREVSKGVEELERGEGRPLNIEEVKANVRVLHGAQNHTGQL